MISAPRDFFSQLIEPGLRSDAAPSEHALQLATAALLLEMMGIDKVAGTAERTSVVAALRTCFGLADDELERLLALADQEAREAAGYYQFTSLLNKACSAGQKVRVIEYLWQVAFADGHLDAHEQHLMRKIADLLYVPQAEYVAAKQRARDAAGKAG